MSVQACAEIVKKGDPDRFLAVMAAPPAARAVLFPLYAFNVEVARAPWVTQESMIAQMRLQWWRDALGEIAAGGIVRRHEVVVPLAGVIGAGDVADLTRLIDAREHDIAAAPFARFEDLERYLADTGGGLMAVATRALGGTDADKAAIVGQVGAAANYLLAVPALIALGRAPLPGDPEGTIRDLAKGHLTRLSHMRRSRTWSASPALRQVWLSTWRARSILCTAVRDPAASLDGRLEGSEFARRAGLLRAQFFGP